jgi:hypothetical protein
MARGTALALRGQPTCHDQVDAETGRPDMTVSGSSGGGIVLQDMVCPLLPKPKFACTRNRSMPPSAIGCMHDCAHLSRHMPNRHADMARGSMPVG